MRPDKTFIREEQIKLKARQDQKKNKIWPLNRFYSSPEKVKAVLSRQKMESQQTPPKVFIAYRTDGSGSGVVFDHHTMQQIGGAETIVAHSVNKSTSILVERMRDGVHDLKFGTPTEASMGRKIPPTVTQAKDCEGLLFIPGVARSVIETPEYQQRREYDNSLIQRAALVGQPIFAVCGGAWEVYQYFGGTLRPAEGHNYRAGMPRMKNNGKVGNNKQIHQILLTEESAILKGAMQKNESKLPDTLTVNSVHWQACDEATLPPQFDISATALHDDNLAPKKVGDAIRQTESGTIEAVESKYGAPILLLQWHPEAYFQNTDAKYHPALHQNIIRYMVQAGHAYILRTKMIKEIKSHWQDNGATSIQSKMKSTNAIRYCSNINFRSHINAKQFYTSLSARTSLSLRHHDELIMEKNMKVAYLEDKYKAKFFEATSVEERKAFPGRRITTSTSTKLGKRKRETPKIKACTGEVVKRSKTQCKISKFFKSKEQSEELSQTADAGHSCKTEITLS